MRCTVGFLFSRLEAVLEQDAAVEDQMVRAAVAGVHAEIAYAHELEARRGLCRAAFMKKRYGFIYVDQDDEGNGTLKRIKKDSFYWFKEYTKNGGNISEEF